MCTIYLSIWSFCYCTFLKSTNVTKNTNKNLLNILISYSKISQIEAPIMDRKCFDMKYCTLFNLFFFYVIILYLDQYFVIRTTLIISIYISAVFYDKSYNNRFVFKFYSYNRWKICHSLVEYKYLHQCILFGFLNSRWVF